MSSKRASVSPLFDAVKHGTVADVAKVLAEGADPNSPDLFLYRPLHAAAQRGIIGIIAELLRAGADINSVGPCFKGTALHTAAHFGNIKVVKYLLSKGASTYAEDHYGCTPERTAREWRHEEVVEVFEEWARISKEKREVK